MLLEGEHFFPNKGLISRLCAFFYTQYSIDKKTQKRKKRLFPYCALHPRPVDVGWPWPFPRREIKGKTWPQTTALWRDVHVRALTRRNEVADGRESARESYRVVNGIYDLDTRHGRHGT